MSVNHAIERAPAPPVAPSRASAPLHLAHIEGLRALAAYVVFINHAYAQVWFPARMQFPPSYLSFLTYSLVAGHLSVTVFIVISGFCLMLPVVRAGNHLRGGALDFFKRRARRILPPYYGAVALCLAAIWTIIGKPTGTLWDVPIDVRPVGILSHLSLLQDLFATGKINYVFWSIAVEWHIYFLFPLLVWSWRRHGAAATVASALVVGYALRFGFADTRLVRASPQYLGLFALGMAGAYLVQLREPSAERLRDRVPWGVACAFFIAVVGVLTRAWGWEVATTRFHIVDLPIGIAAMCALVHTSRSETNLFKRALSFRPLVFIGTFSYSVYLIHAPLLQILWQYVFHPAHLGPVTMFAMFMGPGAVVVLGISYAFFRVFEEPFMRKQRGAVADRSAPAAAVARDEFAAVAVRDRSVP